MKAEKRTQEQRVKVKRDLDRFMSKHQLTKRDLFWFAHMVDYDQRQERKKKSERINKS